MRTRPAPSLVVLTEILMQLDERRSTPLLGRDERARPAPPHDRLPPGQGVGETEMALRLALGDMGELLATDRKTGAREPQGQGIAKKGGGGPRLLPEVVVARWRDQHLGFKGHLLDVAPPAPVEDAP